MEVHMHSDSIHQSHHAGWLGYAQTSDAGTILEGFCICWCRNDPHALAKLPSFCAMVRHSNSYPLEGTKEGSPWRGGNGYSTQRPLGPGALAEFQSSRLLLQSKWNEVPWAQGSWAGRGAAGELTHLQPSQQASRFDQGQPALQPAVKFTSP